MLVGVLLVVPVLLGLASGQTLGQVCWSHEAGVTEEGCAGGTVCQPWVTEKVGFGMVL